MTAPDPFAAENDGVQQNIAVVAGNAYGAECLAAALDSRYSDDGA